MWFKKHLNWTYVFSILTAYIVYYVFVFAILRPIISTDTYALFFVFAYVVGAIVLAAVWGVGAWVISQKKRSLFYLLWLLLGIVGIIIILCLQNQTELKEEAARRAEEIAQDNLMPQVDKKTAKIGRDNLKATSWRQR